MSYSRIHEMLSSGGHVLLDGAIGTELIRRGVRWRQHGIEDAPDVIRQIHVDYPNAGADVITSHTFNLTKRNFINFFRDAEHMAEIGAPDLDRKATDLCRSAMTLAKEALQETNKAGTVPIAGSISTMNHPFRPDLSPDAEECSDHHRECSELLADAGADFIFLEGMNNITEMTEAVRGARGTGLPVWVSLIPDTAGNLLSGESLNVAAAIARKESTDAVLLSGAPLSTISDNLSAILNGTPSGAQATVGRYSPPSWKPDFYPRFDDTHLTTPEQYAEVAEKWFANGARIVGGSSGTASEHIAAIRGRIG